VKTIRVNSPRLGEAERRNLLECIDSGWISSEGPFVKEFEEEFAHRHGRKYGIAVCNGTAALELAVQALDIGSGDEVVMPAFTIISCASAVVRTGGIPVLVDCDAQTWNMNVEQLEAQITARTKAIMVVHIYGLPVDMDPVIELSKKHGLLVIEDAAEAIGLTYRGRACGSFGDISAFSFYPNKHVTTGEGGMLLTDKAELAERCRYYRNLCFQPKRRFVHEHMGWNMRMCNLQAAVGLAQLGRLDEAIRSKRRIGQQYNERLAGLPNIQLPLDRTEYAENVYWVYGIVLGDSIPFDAEEAQRRLATQGIETRPFFWPMHEQPVFRRMGWFERVSCPVSERIARRGFYLPSGVTLSSQDLDQTANIVCQMLA
jgi:perosamine synthetase